MGIPRLCLFRFSSCTVHHKTVVIPVDIPRRWEPRAKQSNGLRLLIFPQPLGRALKNQNAAPTTPPCFSRRLRSSLHWGVCCPACGGAVLFESCTVHREKKSPDRMSRATSFLVDIPRRWEPRTNKHPTGVFVAPPAAVPCCSSPVPSTKTKRPDSNESGCFGGRYRTRTCDLLHVKQMLYQLS